MATRSTPLAYMTAPKGGVHLASSEYATATLCTARITRDWQVGDETLSGLVATCAKCKAGV